MPVTGPMPSRPPQHRSLADIRVKNRDGTDSAESIQDVLDRTKRSRMELDAVIAGADMSDVDHLPVITGYTPTPGKARRKRTRPAAPLGMPAVPDGEWMEKMAGKRKPIGAKLPRGPRATPTAAARAPSAAPAPA